MDAFARHWVRSYRTFPPLPEAARTASGGLFLLHFSSDRSGRALPVILALWSPDFPHGGPFAPATRLSSLLAKVILLDVSRIVKSISLGYNSPSGEALASWPKAPPFS